MRPAIPVLRLALFGDYSAGTWNIAIVTEIERYYLATL